jgi:hypothetical protein
MSSRRVGGGGPPTWELSAVLTDSSHKRKLVENVTRRGNTGRMENNLRPYIIINKAMLWFDTEFSPWKTGFCPRAVEKVTVEKGLLRLYGFSSASFHSINALSQSSSSA